MTAQPRGTSNGNCSGNSAARRRRKQWMVETFRADVDVVVIVWDNTNEQTFWEPKDNDEIEALIRDFERMEAVASVKREPACRCYRCGRLLVACQVTADRIIPGDKGGTYRRNNIRPACGRCNSITGNLYRWSKPGARKSVPA